MTLVLYSATLTDVSDRATRLLGAAGLNLGTSSLDGITNTSALFIKDQTGNTRLLGVWPAVFDSSTWDRLRGDVGGMLYQKPLPVAVRRSPRRILFVDDFEASALKWAQGSGTVSRTTTANEFWDGTAAMKFVTGATAGNACAAYKKWGYQGLQKYVLEFWWAVSAAAATTPRELDVTLQLSDGTNHHNLYVRYLDNLTTPQHKWQYSADGSSWSDIAGGGEVLAADTAAPYSWHYLRLHMDMSAATPNLSELHTDTLDLTGLTANGTTSADTTYFNQLTIGFATDANAATTGFIDDLVLSDSEA